MIAPRICGICSVSQSIAAATALRNHLAGGRAAPNGYLAANLAHAAENVSDHLTHFYLFFMPDFARDEYAGRAWFEATVGALQGGERQTHPSTTCQPPPASRNHGLIAGKWPHSLAFQPGG